MTVFELFDINLHLPKRLSSCKSFTECCSENSHYDDFPVGTLYCTKKSHRVLKESQCHCKLCIKDTPASLKSQTFDKISEFSFYPIPLRKTKQKFQNIHVFNPTASNILWITKPHSAN